MANFYKDNPDIQNVLDALDLSEVALAELEIMLEDTYGLLD